jgi:hypothetical protein
LLVSCLAYSSILKKKWLPSSETSVDFYHSTGRCNIKDLNLKYAKYF